MKRDLPTAEYVRVRLEYDPATGVLTWKPRPVELFRGTPGRTAEHACALWNTNFAGKAAGCPSPRNDYTRVAIDTVLHPAHRLAWLIVTGDWPAADIDHVNGNRADNRWANLREATRAENLQNKSIRSDNTSGFLGVCWDARSGRWKAEIAVNGRKKNLGRYPTVEQANQARIAAEAGLFPFSTRPEVLAFRASQALAFSSQDSDTVLLPV